MTLQTRPETTALVWFRTGLRLTDNTALHHALAENEAVRCLYVLDDNYLRSPDIGAARAAFLFHALQELARSIESHGGQLILRTARTDVPQVVLATAREVGATRIYFNEDYLPYPLARDQRVRQLAQDDHIEVRTFRDHLLVHPDDVRTEDGRPYTVFTPFKRRWQNLLRIPEPYPTQPLLHRLRQDRRFPSAPPPALADYGLHLSQQIEPAGEARAYDRLAHFVRNGLPEYHLQRDFPANPNSTSRLSMHIKWGTLSIRDAYRAARHIGGPGADKWIDELAWREFFHAILFHFPHALHGPMLPEYATFPWQDNPHHLQAWKAGMTGYPFVDAGMRQLNATGWMHNRLRQVVASYLCKDLMIHWQEGERYFMQQLVDGDWPANNGSWQWVAGTGTDPRRATRIFNPTLQMEKYDPHAEFVRQWVPEYGTARYPRPIVPHEIGRQRFLQAFAHTAATRHAARQQNPAQQTLL